VQKQRKQQRIRQSRVLDAHAVAVGASREPVELKRASQRAAKVCWWRKELAHDARRARRPDGPIHRS
jgi:hypothetical protein